MSSRLQDVLLVGDRVSQPLATAVGVGTLYAVDDEGYLIEQSDGAAWVQYGPAGASSVIPPTVQGDLLYASAVDTLVALAKNASATRYLSNTGGSNNPAWAQVNLATGVTGTLPITNGGTGVAAGLQVLLTATVALTDAQIKALSTTAVEIVAAPAANTRIKPVSATLQVSVVTATYTNINATYAQLSLGWDGSTFPWAVVPVVNDSTTTPAMTRVTDLLGGAVHDSIVDLTVPYSEMGGADWWLTQPAVNVSYATTVAKNFAISLDNNGSGNLTGGNAANTMRVVLVYYLEATV